LGQKQTRRGQMVMSAITPESGHCLRLYDCRPRGPENADKSLRRRY
jgi:hypothetical protein